MISVLFKGWTSLIAVVSVPHGIFALHWYELLQAGHPFGCEQLHGFQNFVWGNCHQKKLQFKKAKA